MEALIPCVNDENEILKDIPTIDTPERGASRVPYKIVHELPVKYFESYDLCCTAACSDILEIAPSYTISKKLNGDNCTQYNLQNMMCFS